MKNIALLACFAFTGCLTTSHKIPRGELYALSQKDPNTRGHQVRVIQNLGGREAPPVQGGGVQSNTMVVIHQPIWIDGTPRRHGYSGPRGSRSTTGLGPNKGFGSGTPTAVAKGKKDEAVALLVLAGIAAGGLALTEGLRYDGWMSLHPMHPVHLYGAYGEYTWMPLAHLTPQAASWATRAYIRSDEGPVSRLGRAPLNRVGWNYNFMLGGGQVALTQGGTNPGFQSHLEIGYFPAQHLGILVDFGFGWTEQELDGIENDIVFEKRTGFNLQYMPLSVGKLHLGGYGTIGFSGRADDFFQVGTSSGYWGGGALAQLELTTRMAIIGRAGLTDAYGESLSELLVGISIY